MPYLSVLADVTEPPYTMPEGDDHCSFCGHTGTDRRYRLASQIKGKAEYLCGLCDERERRDKPLDAVPRPYRRLHGRGTSQGRSVDR
jgi:hypothetical protein